MLTAFYLQVKVQWTEQLVAVQKQKTEKIVKETQAMMAVADAEREKAVLEIEVKSCKLLYHLSIGQQDGTFAPSLTRSAKRGSGSTWKRKKSGGKRRVH